MQQSGVADSIERIDVPKPTGPVAGLGKSIARKPPPALRHLAVSQSVSLLLGRPRLVGEHPKQLMWIDDQVVGCQGWASAAWKVGCRDTFIGWTPAQRRVRLSTVADSVRFLVLPWVRIEHLASQVLARSVRGLSAAWQARYTHAVVLAETFVDPAYFAGTCYRAINWQRVGQTRGHAKCGNGYQPHARPKDVWLYPLRQHWRGHLLGGDGSPP